MTIKENLAVSASYINYWKTKPHRLKVELKSLYRESHGSPDYADFDITDEGIIDPITQTPVRSQLNRNTALYEQEYVAFEALEKWAMQADEKVAVWISPPYPGEYQLSKITIFKISYDRDTNKHLNSVSISFNDRNFGIISTIPGYNVIRPEEIRQNIFIIDENIAEEIYNQIKKDGPVDDDEIGLEDYVSLYEEKIKSGVATSEILHEWERDSFVGPQSLGCPPHLGFRDFISSRGRGLESKYVEKCGKCNFPIKKFISKGYVCPCCRGIYEGC